ncbi:hypothetical protein [Streptosporangium sp. NPDC002721]|uniref:hypothetical protein n=1 Tax=Streptosporangium sp. NPDC002721 TaxID=3366188 RepID=UPI0036BD3444
MEQYPRETVEYVYIVVDVNVEVDGLPVVAQVRPYGVRPAADAWGAAAWGEDADGNTAILILIGPGTPWDFSTSPGTFIPWAKVTATPEIPLLEGDPIQIT